MFFGIFTDLGTIISIAFSFILIIGFILCPMGFAIYFYHSKEVRKKCTWLTLTLIFICLFCIFLIVVVITQDKQTIDKTVMMYITIYYGINFTICLLYFVLLIRKKIIHSKDTRVAVQKAQEENLKVREISITQIKQHTFNWKNYMTRYFTTHQFIDEKRRIKALALIDDLLKEERLTKNEHTIETERIMKVA